MKYTVINEYAYIDIKTISYETIQDFFNALIPSKKYQHLCIQNKWICIDEKPVQRNTKIEGEILKIKLYPTLEKYSVKSDLEVEILYEDELFLVVYKPPKMIVHSDGSDKLTMVDLVESKFAKENKLGSIHPIHRLDEDTQGVLIFSKSLIFQGLLDLLLSEKKISRKYIAFVQGKMELNKTMTIDAAIAKDRHNAKKRRVSKDGQWARTIVKCMYSHKDYSVVKCRLESGRTHQIRVHLSHIGYPIINDKLYGRKNKRCQNMGLVAHEIIFYHPLKEEMMCVVGKMSQDLKNLYQ